jgi:hypothetical protein
MFISTLILKHFDSDYKTFIECNFSGYAIEGTLMQYNKEDILQLIIFFSQKNSPAECNYKIHDKKLLVIIKCLRE